jgi:hypothetical protein
MVADLARDINMYTVRRRDPGYTIEDFQSLTIPGFNVNKSTGLTQERINRLRGLLDDTVYINLHCALYLIPFRDLPRYIHENNKIARAIIMWRLTIGK